MDKKLKQGVITHPQDKKKDCISEEKYEIRAVPEDETAFLYSNERRHGELKSIGYLCGDYGRNGNEFWTTWFDHCPDLKTQAFKTEFDSIINHLRKINILKDYKSMSKYFNARQDMELLNQRENEYGCKIETDGHSYYLRAILRTGDYNFYVFCYTV